MKHKDYNLINWHDLFVEDSTSATGLRWRIGRDNRTKAASVVGCVITARVSGNQYFVVRFNKSNWYIHRILWVMRNGSIDVSLSIDHIDGNSFNNSEDNLRLVTRAVNSRNRKKHKDNSTGFTGICFSTNVSGNTYVAAYWNDLHGKRKVKLFSCEKLGKEQTIEQACAYREKMLEELNASGAGYSDRHGE